MMRLYSDFLAGGRGEVGLSRDNLRGGAGEVVR